MAPILLKDKLKVKRKQRNLRFDIYLLHAGVPGMFKVNFIDVKQAYLRLVGTGPIDQRERYVQSS